MGGVDTHKLFELNVRGELWRNPVSRQLDAAIRREHDHSDFLASHNGMTVTATDSTTATRNTSWCTGRPLSTAPSQRWRSSEPTATTSSRTSFAFSSSSSKCKADLRQLGFRALEHSERCESAKLGRQHRPQRRLLKEFAGGFPASTTRPCQTRTRPWNSNGTTHG
jgi:hypothetical protein